MVFQFFCYGHENILSTHKNTIEFTKDSELTLDGDCIIGIKADFNPQDLIQFLKGKQQINCEITVDNIKDIFTFEINPDFNDEHEIVIRKSDFLSERTLGIKANKAAIDINREIIQKLKEKAQLKVEFHEKNPQ